MFRRIVRIAKDNKIYSLMLIFIICVQVISLAADKPTRGSQTENPMTPQEFKQQLEDKQALLKELMEKDRAVAVNFGAISLFIFMSIIAGFIFLTDYIIKKKVEKIERIPKTLFAPRPLWGIPDLLKVVILFLFFHNLFSLIASALSSFFNTGSLDRRAGILASTVFMDLLTFMFILHFVIDKHGQGVETLGLSMKNLFKNIGIAIYSYVSFLPILMLVFFIVAFLAKTFNYAPPPEPIYELIFKEQRPMLLGIIVIMITMGGPIIEEVFFRGFLYQAFRQRYGIFIALSVSALLFSALHTNLIGFLPILMLGLFLAYLREKTGSLIPSIVVHVIHNTILASILFFMRKLAS